jgi:outer membrane protein
MRSAATAFILLVLLAATPLAAQDRPVDWTLWVSSASFGDSTLGEFTAETDDGFGVGLSANFFMSDRFSAELAVFALKSDAEMRFAGIPFDLGDVEIIPVTLGLQFHLVKDSRWDPYIGAGAAWVSARDLESDDLDNLGVGAIDIDTEFSWFAGAGIGYRFGNQVGLAIDVRYIDYEPASTSKVTGVSQDLEFSPLLISLGLRARF